MLLLQQHLLLPKRRYIEKIGLVSAFSKEAQQVQKQIDKIKVQCKCAKYRKFFSHNCIDTVIVSQIQLFQFECIVNG